MLIIYNHIVVVLLSRDAIIIYVKKIMEIEG